MSDDFDNLDLSVGANEDPFSDEENAENRGSRGFSITHTQKLYGNTQFHGQDGKNSDENLNFLDPRNKFEEILKSENVKVAINEDSYEKCIVFCDDLNHEELTRNLEGKLESAKNHGNLLEEFTQACNQDVHMLALYLSPSKSKFGLQDTIFRVFLQIRRTQTKAFELLLQKLNSLAKRSDEFEINLAKMCVAHMRHLNRIFEPQAVFNMIFECPFREWRSSVRDELIATLPEIFTEIGLQQSVALRLNDLILESTQNVSDLPALQLTIMETLRLLRMEHRIGKQIRMNLIGVCAQLDVFCLPALVAFSLGSFLITQSSSAKHDEEEALFHQMLRGLARNLNIEKICKKTRKSDTIVSEVYEHFFRFLQLDRKSWKFITSWISRNKSDGAARVKEEENGSRVDQEEEESTPANSVTTFETLLIISLLSSSESCPPTFVTAVNSRIMALSTTNASKFLKQIDLAISLKKFSSGRLSSLIHVAKYCLWAPDENIRRMGVSVWKQLLVGMERKNRVEVFNELMNHFTQSELECEAVLDVFAKVIKSSENVIHEFSSQVYKCVELMHNMSIANIKKLFRVILMMPAAGTSTQNFNISEIINRLLTSVSEREKFLGVLALLMKVQVEMSKRHTENQEVKVREGVTRIEEAVKESPNLRGAFYEHMRSVIETHTSLDEIRFIVEWSDDLLRRFRDDFFVENEDSSMEGDSSEITLQPNPLRIIEVTPMFNLIKELLLLRNRWREENSVVDSPVTDVDSISELNFAFTATVSLDTGNTQLEKCNYLFFLTQWTRNILNSFLAQSSPQSEPFSKQAIKLFYIMTDSEAKLATALSSMTQWTIPNLTFEKKEDVIVLAADKKTKKRKRKSDESLVETMAEEVNEETTSNIDVTTTIAMTGKLKPHFVQLEFRPIVHLLNLTKNKRSCLVYLCDELQNVLETLIKLKKKTSPMLAARAGSMQNRLPKVCKTDSLTVWSCVKKAIEHVWNIVDTVFNFFSTLTEEDVNPKLEKDMEELGFKSLHILHTIFSAELYGSDEKLSAGEKADKRNVLIRILERKILDKEVLSSDTEQAKMEVVKYIVGVAKFAATPAVAVALLDVFEDLKLDEEEREDDVANAKKSMAKYALAYLKRDWSNVDEIWCKGTKFNSAVRDILSHYIRLRKEKDQLLAIRWILTNKVVQLVPEDDKRKSCIFSQHSDDDLLEEEDQKALFHCISKSTFGVIFKTLFGGLNTRVNRPDMSATAAKNMMIDEEDTLESWELASSCFLILCLLLRVNKIRTTAVLTTAIREGKQFLATFSKKSSFIFLLDKIIKGTNIDQISVRVERIISAVQQGNRVLQSIGNYAKAHKCVHLLKTFPELRAEGENCLRVIHSAMVKNECLNAFTVGLVISRSIDGEIITEDRDISGDMNEEDEEED